MELVLMLVLIFGIPTAAVVGDQVNSIKPAVSDHNFNKEKEPILKL